jgi:hypothetical protein
MTTIKTKALCEMTNEELKMEWKMWDEKIKNATSWGAALAAAVEFKKDCEREMRLRGVSP